MDSEFKGKSVLITGSATGIGRATAIAFAKEGANLTLADVNTEENEKTKASAEEHGVKVQVISCDVREEEQVQAIVAAAVESYGQLDIAINNAGVDQPPAPLFMQSVETYKRVMDINALGVWLCMKHEILAMMPNKNGVIINTSSISDSMGPPFMQTYAASKHAVLGLTRAAACEVASVGIRINAVAPGPVKTEMLVEFDAQHPGSIDTSISAMPIGKIAMSEDLADAILCVASEKARFIVGQSIKVDGGFTIAYGMSEYPSLG